MASAASSLLDAETFSASSERDALGRVLVAISPDGSEALYTELPEVRFHMGKTLEPGSGVNFVSFAVHRMEVGRILEFKLRGPVPGPNVCTWQDRERLVGDDARPSVMRSVEAARDSVLCSVMTIEGQVLIWCHKTIFYSATVDDTDSIWMAPRVSGIWRRDQIVLEADCWSDFWIDKGALLSRMNPGERLSPKAPRSGVRRVRQEDADLDPLRGERINCFVCTNGGAVYFSTPTSVGYLFTHMTRECVVVLPRMPPSQ